MQNKKTGKFNWVLSSAVIAVFLFGAVLTVGAAGPAGGDAKGGQQLDGIPPANDIQKVAACPYCGMDRRKFAHSRVYIEYDNGSHLGTCSIHCAAVDMAVNIDKGPMKIWVGDYNSKDLIDAENAVWVIGGDQMGVMTKRAKWAFKDPAAADQFMKAHGGKVAGFEEAVEGAYADMYQDTRLIRERRAKKRMMQQPVAK